MTWAVPVSCAIAENPEMQFRSSRSFPVSQAREDGYI